VILALVWMSATMMPQWLDTVDFRQGEDAPGRLELDDADSSPPGTSVAGEPVEVTSCGETGDSSAGNRLDAYRQYRLSFLSVCNQTEFYRMLARLMPRKIHADVNTGISLVGSVLYARALMPLHDM